MRQRPGILTLGLTDYSQVGILSLRYKSAKFGAKRPGIQLTPCAGGDAGRLRSLIRRLGLLIYKKTRFVDFDRYELTNLPGEGDRLSTCAHGCVYVCLRILVKLVIFDSG